MKKTISLIIIIAILLIASAAILHEIAVNIHIDEISAPGDYLDDVIQPYNYEVNNEKKYIIKNPEYELPEQSDRINYHSDAEKSNQIEGYFDILSEYSE